MYIVLAAVVPGAGDPHSGSEESAPDYEAGSELSVDREGEGEDNRANLSRIGVGAPGWGYPAGRVR